MACPVTGVGIKTRCKCIVVSARRPAAAAVDPLGIISNQVLGFMGKVLTGIRQQQQQPPTIFSSSSLLIGAVRGPVCLLDGQGIRKSLSTFELRSVVGHPFISSLFNNSLSSSTKKKYPFESGKPRRSAVNRHMDRSTGTTPP